MNERWDEHFGNPKYSYHSNLLKEGMLFSRVKTVHHFSNIEITLSEEEETGLFEGFYHIGVGAVLRVAGLKK